MKRFRINVNGKSYDVEVEELTEAEASAAPAAPATAPAAVPAPAAPAVEKAATTPPPAAAPVSGDALKAPMPGNIVKILVSRGKTVKKGEALLILEAMKMENEIMAERDGAVAAVHVSEGAQVNAGDPLVTIA